MLKKILIVAAVVALLVGAFVAWVVVTAFGNNKPVEDGATYERITVVEDVDYVSLYVIDIGGGKNVIVDGGVDESGEKVRALLAQRGTTADSVVAVLLTHGHSDHIGAAYGFTNVPLYAHRADVPLVEGERANLGAVSQLGGTNPPGLKVTNPFEDGDKLKFGDVELEVFHAPGHTQGNSAFLVDGVMLLGDTAQVTEDERLHSPPFFFSDDPEAAIAAIRALGEEIKARPTQPTRLVGSHSGSTTRVDSLTSYQGDD